MKYIHIAGTNAKGSVSEYIYHILMAEGISCGVFTSPHLFTPAERMRMNGKSISDAEYQKYMESAGGEEEEHLFRKWTRASLAWFEDGGADVAVIETGIGGSKDSTNAIDAGIAVLTPISLDHTKILGDSIEKIARDKCGIIKKDATVITYGQKESVMRVIRAACDKKNAKLVTIGSYTLREAGRSGQRFDYGDLKDLYISAISPHQVENACGAVEAALAAGAHAGAIREGLANASLQARVQVLDSGMIVDGAHNPAAIEELRLTLEKYFDCKDILVLTAVMRDKDAKKISAGIKKFAHRVVCTCVDRERGLPAFDYSKYYSNADYFSDARSAYRYAKMLKPELLVICGSFYLAGRVLQIYPQLSDGGLEFPNPIPKKIFDFSWAP